MSPPNIINNSPVHVNRIIVIESAMDEIKSQHKATHQLLQSVLDKLGPGQAQNMSDLIQPLIHDSAQSSPIPASSAGRKKNFLKPSAPSEFNGDRSAGKAFLTSCRTYICLSPESFEGDLTKVVWAMSYMKSGRAGRWATHEFEHEAKSGQHTSLNTRRSLGISTLSTGSTLRKNSERTSYRSILKQQPSTYWRLRLTSRANARSTITWTSSRTSLRILATLTRRPL